MCSKICCQVPMIFIEGTTWQCCMRRRRHVKQLQRAAIIREIFRKGDDCTGIATSRPSGFEGAYYPDWAHRTVYLYLYLERNEVF